MDNLGCFVLLLSFITIYESCTATPVQQVNGIVDEAKDANPPDAQPQPPSSGSVKLNLAMSDKNPPINTASNPSSQLNDLMDKSTSTLPPINGGLISNLDTHNSQTKPVVPSMEKEPNELHKSDSGPKSVSGTNADSGIKADPETKADSETKADLESKVDSQPKANSKPKASDQGVSNPKSATNPLPDSCLKLKPDQQKRFPENCEQYDFICQALKNYKLKLCNLNYNGSDIWETIMEKTIIDPKFCPFFVDKAIVLPTVHVLLNDEISCKQSCFHSPNKIREECLLLGKISNFLTSLTKPEEKPPVAMEENVGDQSPEIPPEVDNKKTNDNEEDDLENQDNDLNLENTDDVEKPEVQTPEKAVPKTEKQFISNVIETEMIVQADDSHFFTYFLMFTCLVVLGYIGFHNKNKILALALEGRRHRSTRRRSNSTKYSKLESNLEETMMSNPSQSMTTQIIY